MRWKDAVHAVSEFSSDNGNKMGNKWRHFFCFFRLVRNHGYGLDHLRSDVSVSTYDRSRVKSRSIVKLKWKVNQRGVAWPPVRRGQFPPSRHVTSHCFCLPGCALHIQQLLHTCTHQWVKECKAEPVVLPLSLITLQADVRFCFGSNVLKILKHSATHFFK